MPILPERLLRDAGIERDLLPRVAAVGGLPQTAAAAAGVHAPRRALELPHRREEDARIGRIDREVDRAGGVVEEEHLLPRLAAVGRAEDAALRVRSEGVAHRGDEHAVGVARVDDDVADLLRVVEAEMLPAVAAVGRAIHARAVGQIFAQLRFAGADLDHVRIGRRDGDRADRGDVGLAVGDVAPGLSAVRRLPHAAVHRAEVEDQWLRRVAGDGVPRVRRGTGRRGASCSALKRGDVARRDREEAGIVGWIEQRRRRRCFRSDEGRELCGGGGQRWRSARATNRTMNGWNAEPESLRRGVVEF